jgi:hypothetical protein
MEYSFFLFSWKHPSSNAWICIDFAEHTSMDANVTVKACSPTFGIRQQGKKMRPTTKDFGDIVQINLRTDSTVYKKCKIGARSGLLNCDEPVVLFGR